MPGKDLYLMKLLKDSIKRMLGLGLGFQPDVDCPGLMFLGSQYGGCGVRPSSGYNFMSGAWMLLTHQIIMHVTCQLNIFGPLRIEE